MKRRFQMIVFCFAFSLAAPLTIAQDNSGAGGGDAGAGGAAGNGGTEGGDTSGDNGGITPSPGANALGGQNGTGTQTQPAQTQGSGGQNGAGAGTNGGGLFGPGNPSTPENGAAPDTGIPAGSTITPNLSTPPPSFLTPNPASTGANPPSGNNALNAGVLSAPAPVSLSLPGGYGTSGKTFTLGQGRLAKPPIIFTLTLSQGYDDNIFSTPNIPGRNALTQLVPGAVQQQIIGYHLTFPFGPIVKTTKGKSTTVMLAPAVPAQKPVGSAVTTANLGVQIQKADPRTVFTLDGSLGALDYWTQVTKEQYNGTLGLDFIHRLTPRATLTASVDAAYQNQPDFSRMNAPTSNVTSAYLNASSKIDLSYGWTPRFGTVASLGLGLTQDQGQSGNDVQAVNYGLQGRFRLSPQNTVTLELRQSQDLYKSQSSSDTYLLVGLDSSLGSRLRNTFATGEEINSSSQGGTGVPYFESTTTYALPRGGAVQWTNRYGLDDTSNRDQTVTSFRTGLNFSQLLSAKLSASLGLNYNHLDTVDHVTASSSNTQTQLQSSISLQYSATPRLSYSLSYNFFQLLSSLPSTGYTRDQVYIGMTYSY